MDPEQAAALAREAQERMEVLEAKGLTPERIAKVSEAAAQVDEIVERLRASGVDLSEITEIAERHQSAPLQPIIADDGPSNAELSATLDALAERVDKLEARLDR